MNVYPPFTSTSLYITGGENRLLNDGRYSYQYDAEGNRTFRYSLTGFEYDKYTWDHRNRLTKVERFAPREFNVFSFDSDNAGRAIDDLGNATHGLFMGDTELEKVSDHPLYEDPLVVRFANAGDYISFGVQDESFLLRETGMSLTAWVQPDVAAMARGILSYGDAFSSTDSGYALYLEDISGTQRLVFRLNDGVGAAQEVAYVLSSSMYNTWNHVGVTIDLAGQITVYWNGVAVAWATTTESVFGPNMTFGFTIGALSGGVLGQFSGLIDDVRVAHQPLSAAQMAQIADIGIAYLLGRLSVDYGYDHMNQQIFQVTDPDGPAGPLQETAEFRIYDGGQVVMRFDGDSTLTHRYLWGTQVDQLLVDEVLSLDTSDPPELQVADILWALTDNLGSINDLVRYDAVAETTDRVVHRIFDAFGQQTISVSSTAESVDTLFGYTGRPFDAHTGLQNNLNRWYDPRVGRWLSEDPISFAAGDANLYRYVGNSPTNATDSSGLEEEARVLDVKIFKSGKPSTLDESFPGSPHARLAQIAISSHDDLWIKFDRDKLGAQMKSGYRFNKQYFKLIFAFIVRFEICGDVKIFVDESKSSRIDHYLQDDGTWKSIATGGGRKREDVTNSQEVLQFKGRSPDGWRDPWGKKSPRYIAFVDAPSSLWHKPTAGDRVPDIEENIVRQQIEVTTVDGKRLAFLDHTIHLKASDTWQNAIYTHTVHRIEIA